MNEQETSAQLEALQAENAQLRAERAVLLGRAELLSRLFDSIPVAISFNGRDQRMQMINPALARVFGTSPEALVGRKPGDLFPSYAKVFDRVLEPTLERGETFQGHDIEFPDPKDGRLFADVAAVPVYGTDGQVEGALLMTVDTTARVERERWQAELIAQLRAVDRSKDEFLGVLSHELRTPLNGIMGFTSILEDGGAGAISPEQRAYLERVEESTERMLGIVDELVTVSQLLLGKVHLMVEPIALAEAVGPVIARWAPAAAKRRIMVETRLPDGLPPVSADPHRLDQVLSALVDNAIKFTPPGGRIVVSARPEGGFVRCEVADTGVGIALADQPRVFDRFYQADSSSTRPVGGLGLGLALVKSLVEAQGGHVGLQSALGEGSTFWFALPLAEAP